MLQQVPPARAGEHEVERLLGDLDDEEFYKAMVARVRAQEVRNKDKMRKNGRRFLGERKIGKQHWNRAPRSTEDKFVMLKRIRDRDARKRRAALARHKDWRVRYADARNRRRAGEQDVEFPFGTYWMRRFAGVKVAKPPP